MPGSTYRTVLIGTAGSGSVPADLGHRVSCDVLIVHIAGQSR